MSPPPLTRPFGSKRSWSSLFGSAASVEIKRCDSPVPCDVRLIAVPASACAFELARRTCVASSRMTQYTVSAARLPIGVPYPGSYVTVSPVWKPRSVGNVIVSVDVFTALDLKRGSMLLKVYEPLLIVRALPLPLPVTLA